MTAVAGKLLAVVVALTAADAAHQGPEPSPQFTAAQDSVRQSGSAQERPLRVPFGVGERLAYEVRFGKLRVGSGTMEVLDIAPLRGRDTWHTAFRVKGGTFFYRVNDVFESWIDTSSLASLRFVKDQQEGGKEREKRYEIFPDRKVYVEEGKAEQPSVAQPLDDGSFLYFIRTVRLEVGKTYEFHRYFRPDRNPVTIRVLRKERISVPAGKFDAIVIQPVIKAKGIFSENGHAEIWLADDSTRIMLQMKSKLSFGSLNLYLKSYRPPTTSASTAAVSGQ